MISYFSFITQECYDIAIKLHCTATDSSIIPPSSQRWRLSSKNGVKNFLIFDRFYRLIIAILSIIGRPRCLRRRRRRHDPLIVDPATTPSPKASSFRSGLQPSLHVADFQHPNGQNAGTNDEERAANEQHALIDAGLIGQPAGERWDAEDHDAGSEADEAGRFVQQFFAEVVRQHGPIEAGPHAAQEAEKGAEQRQVGVTLGAGESEGAKGHQQLVDEEQRRAKGLAE